MTLSDARDHIGNTGPVSEFSKGDCCRIVEHDEKTGRALRGGIVYEAVVADVDAMYVKAVIRSAPGGSLWAFYRRYGYWGASRRRYRWRLMPATDAAAATVAGED